MARNPHQLTRDEMNKIIDRGESVMMPDGRIISHKSELPGEAEVSLQLNDPERVRAARLETEKQIEDLKKRLGEMAEAEAQFNQGPAHGQVAPAGGLGPQHGPQEPSTAEQGPDPLAAQRQALLAGTEGQPAAGGEPAQSKPEEPADKGKGRGK